MGIPAPGQLSLERRLVELRVTEGGEGCGPALHRRDEALLAYDNVRSVAVLGLLDEVQRLSPTRATPHRAGRFEREGARSISYALIASIGQITGLNRCAKAGLPEIDRGRDRLCPGGNHPGRDVNFRPDCDEAVLLDQVARKLGETIAITVTVKAAEPKHEPQNGA